MLNGSVLLIDREVTFRDNRRLSRRLAAAKRRQTATIENIDYLNADQCQPINLFTPSPYGVRSPPSAIVNPARPWRMLGVRHG
jgi:hypothetical protein